MGRAETLALALCLCAVVSGALCTYEIDPLDELVEDDVDDNEEAALSDVEDDVDGGDIEGAGSLGDDLLPVPADVDVVWNRAEANVSSSVPVRLLWHAVLYVVCPAHESAAHLQWPYDYWSSRYPCGRGPARRHSHWPAGVHVLRAGADALHQLAAIGDNYTALLAAATAATGNESAQTAAAGAPTADYNWCALVAFYALHCAHSRQLAAALNRLPALYPNLYVIAVDASVFSRVHSRYGIAGTPTLLLWHRERAVARYAGDDYTFRSLHKFITRWTDLERDRRVPQQPSCPVEELRVANDSDADAAPVSDEQLLADMVAVGALPCAAPGTEGGVDWTLCAAWFALVASTCYAASHTQSFWTLLAALRRAWREANEAAAGAVIEPDDELEAERHADDERVGLQPPAEAVVDVAPP